MKRRYTQYIISAALAIPMMFGCNSVSELDTPDSPMLRAVIEGGETRVDFDDASGKFAWDADGTDKIAVYVGSTFEQVAVAANGAFRVEGTGERSFYAIYPYDVAPANKSALTVTLPASYDISDGDFDYTPVPMVAQNINGQDALYFYHVGGLVRIHCKGVASTTTAVVTFDKDVTGTYTVNTSDAANPTITTARNNGNNTVTFTVGGKTNFVLNVPVPCGTYTNISLKLDGATAVKLNESDLTFARHHGKQFINGNVTFDYVLEGLHNVEAEYLGGTKELAQIFTSYKTDGTDKSVVPFKIQFSEDGTNWYDAGDENAPEWVSVVSGVDFSGSTHGQAISLSITPQDDSAHDDYHDILAERDPKTDFDLSYYNVATDKTTTEQNTANTYVVSAPGTYKFPLVYGNAIKNGANNEIAYHTQKADGSWRNEPERCSAIGTGSRYEAYWLGYFQDHLDQNITHPYIYEQHSGKTLSAKLIFESSEGLITDVAIDGTGTYLTFKVPKESITQGTALVSVLADGEIAWSWNIWITDHDLKAVQGPGENKFMPEDIGWIGPRYLQRYDKRSCYVRAVQTVTGGRTSDPYEVVSNPGNTVHHSGYASVFTHELPNAFPGTYLETNELHKDYPVTAKHFYDASYPLTVKTGDIINELSLGNVIQHPNYIYSPDDALSPSGCTWRNIWSSTQNASVMEVHETETVKTVYDPSPVGYKVPPISAFDGFNDENLPMAVRDGIDGRLYDNTLFFHRTPRTGLAQIFRVAWTALPAYQYYYAFACFYYTSDYVYGTTTNNPTARNAVRPVQE